MKILEVNNERLERAYAEFLQKREGRNLWQSAEWGRVQKTAGKAVRRFVVFDTLKRGEMDLPGEVGAVIQIVENKLPLGKRWWYAPRGPVWENEEAVRALFAFLEKQKIIFMVCDPFEILPVDLRTVPAHSVQPEETLVLDLRLSEEELLAQMKQKGRYNLRLAEKKGVMVREGKVENFYKLLQETTERDGFRGWGKGFYKKMLAELGERAVLYEAMHEGEVIAAGVFVFWNELAIYYYGASGNKKRNLMAPYLVQWEAIREAKRRGCTEYDFLGIAPEGVEKHAWAGVTDFKLKFGGERKIFPQAKKVVVSGFWNLVYEFYKKLRG